jgi:cell wall-associated NlpC family hydrolase
MPDNAPTPERILAEARGWLGVPWRHQGRTRAGVDCAGLVVMVGRALGLTDYDTTGYSRRAHGQAFVRHFQAAMDDVRLPEAILGDVLVFADHAYPCHCGFLTTKWQVPHLLHAHVIRRKVVEEPYAGEWPEKVKFAFRFRGLALDAETHNPAHVLRGIPGVPSWRN